MLFRSLALSLFPRRHLLRWSVILVPNLVTPESTRERARNTAREAVKDMRNLVKEVPKVAAREARTPVLLSRL